MDETRLVVPVLPGSVRRDRQRMHVRRFVGNRRTARGYKPVLVDPVALPLLDRMYKEHPTARRQLSSNDGRACIGVPTAS